MGFRDPKNFIDRELSWLAFNKRVLEEALDPKTPLLERVKFAGIVATNLDEFFMIRVSGVQEQMRSDVRRKSISGQTPGEQFQLVHAEAHKQFNALYKCWRDAILPELDKAKVQVAHPRDLSRKLRKELRERFDREIYPVLTPLAVDSGHPFPRLKSLSLNIIVRLEGMKRKSFGESLIAIVQVPGVLPRLVQVPAAGDRMRYVLLEDLIVEHVDELFPGMKVLEAVPFRVTRDADIEYKEIDAEDLLKYIEEEIRERERGMAVRLEISDSSSEIITGFLAANLKLEPVQLYRIRGPIAINELGGIWKLDGREHLKEDPFTPSFRKAVRGPGSIFSKIRKQDILLHHPYESFAPVVDFITEAARDPRVLAIKMTLYRTSGDSPLIKALIDAADNGKQVTALVELKARFDEENNIVWARQMEEAGVHVVYGLVGLKTHCKVALVVRNETSGIKRYVHLGTGNYNPTTARIYTDLGLFTSDADMGADASELFNLLTGYSWTPKWKHMVVAPQDLHDRTIELINEQRERAEKGLPARIRAKMNSVTDQDIICELYRASCAGVQIDLCVRGICCLRPGIKGVSENIRVWSIVDRFLEHTRIFIFGPDDDAQVFLSSADWMERNMKRRIEVMFPVTEDAPKERLIHEVFAAAQKGNVKSRLLLPDGTYRRIKPKPGQTSFRCQLELLKLEERVSEDDKWEGKHISLPLTDQITIAEQARLDAEAAKLGTESPSTTDTANTAANESKAETTHGKAGN